MSRQNPSVQFVSLEQARMHFDAGGAIFADTRDREDYERSHVPGAVSMPLTEVPRRYRELPRDRRIITYCT